MRLREMQLIIQENINKLKYSAESNGSGNTKVNNYMPAIYALENLKRISFFNSLISKIENNEIMKSRLESIIVTNTVYGEFDNQFKYITTTCRNLLTALNESLPDQDSYSISIKLPPVQTLQELIKCINDFDKLFEQSIVTDDIQGKVEVQNFDSGSFWIEVTVASGFALSFFAGLAWSAAVIRKKIYEGDIIEQKAQALEIKAESLEDIRAALNKQLNFLCEAEAVNLLKENGLEEAVQDNERVQRIKHSIKTLASLINKGAEVHPALTAPEEVQNLFPDFSKLPLIESKIKNLPPGVQSE